MNQEEIMERARQLRAAGVPLAEIEKYVQSKMAALQDDTVEVNASYPERLATTVLEATQVLPGMKSFQAAMGSLGSKFTDTPVSYRDARAGLEEQGQRMHPGLRIAAKAAALPMLIPAGAATGVKGLVSQGAILGAADQALDVEPGESLESRMLRTAGGAAVGGLGGGVLSGASKIARLPSGTVPKIAKAVVKELPVGRSVSRAMRAANRVTTAAKVLPMKPAATIADDALTLEQRLGLTPESLGLVDEAAEAAVPAAKPWKPRSAPKARFDYIAERMAKRPAVNPTASDATAAAEPTLEELLDLSNQHLKKGGTLEDLLKVNPGRRPR